MLQSRPGRDEPDLGSVAAAVAAAELSLSRRLAMAGSSSLEAVRRKIRSLQEQADAAEERAGSLQRELDQERKLRETVRDPPIIPGAPTPHLAHLGHLAPRYSALLLYL